MERLLNSYNTISLAWLQAKSELMEREESKYLLHMHQLEQVLSNLHEHYDILEINNIRQFTYENVYFDTDEYFFYHQHLQQYKSRTKVRTRKYVDSQLDFIEYKQKINKVIKKERITIWEEDFWHISPETIWFLESCFNKYYKKDKAFNLIPTLRNQYQRITLCHKTQKERVTIDINIWYSEPDSTEPNLVLDHLAIIECKHAEKQPYFKKIMIQKQIPEVNLCSKYCLWTYYLGKTKNFKSFLPTIIYIDTLKNTHTVSSHFVKDYQQRIKDNKRQIHEWVMSGSSVL